MADAKKSAAKKTESPDLSDSKTNSSEPEVQAEIVTGRPFGEVQSGILGGPSQDDLNPAFARPKDPENDKDESPNQVDPPAAK